MYYRIGSFLTRPPPACYVELGVSSAAGNHVSRRQIHVRGIVQGVGFRPFVYNLAQRLQLAGYVLNSSAGVVIEVEGRRGGTGEFRAFAQR